MIHPTSVVSWVMIVGLVFTLPAVLITDPSPSGLNTHSAIWLFLAGLGNIVGILFAYQALRIGKVGLVAPVTSTEGAIAALVAVAAGEALAPGAGLLLVAITIGVVLSAVAPDEDGEGPKQTEARAVALASAAAVALGISLYATGRAGEDLPVVWVLLSARLIGVVAIAIPLALRHRLELSREAAPLLVATGLVEIGGVICFTIGSRHGIAVASVLASQFAAFAALAAFLIFHERLGRVQLIGVVLTLAGVGLLSLVQA